jgi:hypothetical protein
MIEKMIIFFDESLENIQVNSFLQNFNEYFQQKLYDNEQKMKKEYEFTKKCYFCIDFDSYNYISGTSATLKEKLNSKYCSSTNVREAKFNVCPLLPNDMLLVFCTLLI